MEDIVIANPDLAAGFCAIPNHILKTPKISPGAKTTFFLLLYYAWYAGFFPGEEELAGDLGVSPGEVRSYLRELEEAGLVKARPQNLGAKRHGRS